MKKEEIIKEFFRSWNSFNRKVKAKEEILKLVDKTNKIFGIGDYKEEIPIIAKDIERINKLAKILHLKVYLRINDDIELKEMNQNFK